MEKEQVMQVTREFVPWSSTTFLQPACIYTFTLINTREYKALREHKNYFVVKLVHILGDNMLNSALPFPGCKG